MGAWLFRDKNYASLVHFQKIVRIAESPKEKLCPTTLPSKCPNFLMFKCPNVLNNIYYYNCFNKIGEFQTFGPKGSSTEFFWHFLSESQLLLQNRHSLFMADNKNLCCPQMKLSMSLFTQHSKCTVDSGVGNVA